MYKKQTLTLSKPKKYPQTTHVPPFVLYGFTIDVLGLLKLTVNATNEFTYKILLENKMKIQANNVKNNKKQRIVRQT